MVDVYRARKSQESWDHLLYVADWLRADGRTILVHESQEAQYRYGDLRIDERDVEHKFDQKFHLTGNVFIEFDERARTGKLVPSGIYAGSTAIWYLVGDYCTLFPFKRKDLRSWWKARTPEEQKALTREAHDDDGNVRGHGFLLSAAARATLKHTPLHRRGRTPLGAVVPLTRDDVYPDTWRAPDGSIPDSC